MISLYKKSIGSLLLIYATICTSMAQDDPWTAKPTLGYDLYIDLYYGYDFNQPSASTRLPYLYNYNRHNETNLNLGFIGFNVQHNKYRAAFKLQTGTFVNDNYSNEPDLLKAINDANIGLALNKRSDLWLDVGIFGNSYIGYENTYGFNNLNLGHSILSENVPYFLSGLSLTYTPKNWTFAFWLVNGWQRIQRVQGNSLPGIGTQINYSEEQWSVNWSTFLGTEDPDSTRRIRFFNHFNGSLTLSDRWFAVLAFDIGVQQKVKNSSDWNNWIGVAAALEYHLHSKGYLVGRYEYYNDTDEVIVSTEAKMGYITSGYALTYRYHFNKILLAKVEARYFNSPDNIYPKAGSFVNNNLFIAGNLIVKIDGTFK